MGCAFPEAEQGFNLAKIVGQLAQLPESVAGPTVNRFCGSSMTTIHMAAGYMQTPTLGLLLIAGAAFVDDRPAVIEAVGAVCLATSAILVGVMAIFAYDVLQMRALRDPEAQSAVLTSAAFQEVKFGVAIVVFALLGLGARRTAKALARRS